MGSCLSGDNFVSLSEHLPVEFKCVTCVSVVRLLQLDVTVVVKRLVLGFEHYCQEVVDASSVDRIAG